MTMNLVAVPPQPHLHAPLQTAAPLPQCRALATLGAVPASTAHPGQAQAPHVWLVRVAKHLPVNAWAHLPQHQPRRLGDEQIPTHLPTHPPHLLRLRPLPTRLQSLAL